MFADTIFQKIADFGNSLLFFDVLFWTEKASLPFLIFWLLFASIYFAVITKFINFRALPRAIVAFIKGKKSVDKKENTASTKSIVLSAMGGATDLGSMFGVAGIVAIGGPGTLFWLIIAGLLSTSIRYAEVYCGHKFRKKHFSNGNANGYVGGPQIYIRRIFSMYKLKKLGKTIATIYAVMLCLSTFCSLQINQTVHIFTHMFPELDDYTFIIALVVASIIISVAIRGITGVAKFSQKVIPPMVILYIIITISILVVKSNNIYPAIKAIFDDAFSFRAVNGGILGSFVLGFQRAFFCNESGMGSGAIIHANSSNKNSHQEAIVAMIAPIVSVVIVCLCSGFIVLVSGSYNQGSSGIDYIINSFSILHKNAKYLTIVIVPLFGITTAITWAYYGSKQFASIFGGKKAYIYYALLFVSYFMCGIVKDFGVILDVADFLNLSITIPNIIALLMMTKFIANGQKDKQTRKKTNVKKQTGW